MRFLIQMWLKFEFLHPLLVFWNLVCLVYIFNLSIYLSLSGYIDLESFLRLLPNLNIQIERESWKDNLKLFHVY